MLRPRTERKKEMYLFSIVSELYLTRAFSALYSSLQGFKGLKKGKVKFCVHLFSLYGRFLSISTASAATHMIITITITATPNITVPVDAKPVGGEAVGAAVGAGALA